MKPGALVVLLLVHAALVLGGVFLMLVQFGDELDSELDAQVVNVQRDVERDLKSVERRVIRQLRAELDARFP